MDNLKNISKMLRFHRKKSGLSQKELADMAGVGKTVIFDLEKGKESVRWNTLNKVLTVLNIKLTAQSPLMPEYEKDFP